MLYQLGAYTFEVAPLNMHETEEEVGHDLAAKDIIGALRPHEAMGEADNKRTFKGRLFPHKLGGVASLEGLKATSKSGIAQMLIRGDGSVFGWWFIERVRETHTYIDRTGVGRLIEFDIELIKSPTAPNAGTMGSMISTLMSLF
jgi:uncharacterized protein